MMKIVPAQRLFLRALALGFGGHESGREDRGKEGRSCGRLNAIGHPIEIE